MLVNNNHVYVGLPKQQVPNSSVLDKGLVAEFRKPHWHSIIMVTTRQPVIPQTLPNLKVYIV